MGKNMQLNDLKLTPSQLLILKKLHQSLSKNKSSHEILDDGKRWIRNSYASWQKQLGLYSTLTIRRAFAKLEKLNLVQSKTFPEGKKFIGGEQVKYYTLNLDPTFKKNIIEFLKK